MSFNRYYNKLKNKHNSLVKSVGHICSNGRKTIVADVYKDGRVITV